ncbi:MAG: hypothetical protein ACYDBB_10595 [Armatimonadota bacterium]
MLSRGYLFFIGILLTVMGIVGYMAPNFLGALSLSSIVPTVWLVTGLISLAVGFFTRNVNTLRWFAGIVGIVYLAWGAFALFRTSDTPMLNLGDLLSLITTGLGALGVSAALAPAQWIREREVYAHNA